jgi:hypothetical protein
MRRQLELNDWGLDDAELACVVRLYERIMIERGKRWHGVCFHWAKP